VDRNRRDHANAGDVRGLAKENPTDVEEAETTLRMKEVKTVHDQGLRSTRQIARVTGSLLAVLVLLFAGSVRAQDPPRIGMKIRTLTVEHKLPEDAKGALVTAITAGSPAQEKGIVVGDVIVEAAGKPVDTAQAVAKSIAAESESIALKVMNSKGERRDVTVPVAKKPAGGSAPFLPGPK
jgi:membrane-associated protease RseP (regulator of RpoE activity)